VQVYYSCPDLIFLIILLYLLDLNVEIGVFGVLGNISMVSTTADISSAHEDWEHNSESYDTVFLFKGSFAFSQIGRITLGLILEKWPPGTADIWKRFLQ
jgi:hypothetical protein